MVTPLLLTVVLTVHLLTVQGFGHEVWRDVRREEGPGDQEAEGDQLQVPGGLHRARHLPSHHGVAERESPINPPPPTPFPRFSGRFCSTAHLTDHQHWWTRTLPLELCRKRVDVTTAASAMTINNSFLFWLSLCFFLTLPRRTVNKNSSHNRLFIFKHKHTQTHARFTHSNPDFLQHYFNLVFCW